MKQTLNLLVTRSGLQAQDKLGIVVFDHNVQIVLPLTSMDQAGRAKAKAAIDAVCVGGQTNLSGGLMQGLQMLCQSDEAEKVARTAFSKYDVIGDNVLHKNELFQVLLDYDAVKSGLDSGKVGALGLDVQWEEPFDPADYVARHPSVVLTPHVAGVTELSYSAMGLYMAEKLIRLRDEGAIPS